MLYLFFTILGFALGSTLFAYWTPKIIRHIDIRELPADHNPGVANAFMYGGFFCGLLSLILELAKGFVPVFLGQRFLDTHSLLFFRRSSPRCSDTHFHFSEKKKAAKQLPPPLESCSVCFRRCVRQCTLHFSLFSFP